MLSQFSRSPDITTSINVTNCYEIVNVHSNYDPMKYVSL